MSAAAGGGENAREERRPVPELSVLHVAAGYPTATHPHSHAFVATQVDSLRALGVDCEVLALQGGAAVKFAGGYRLVRRALARRRAGRPFDLIHAHHSWCGAASGGNGVPVVLSLLGSDLWSFPWSNDEHGPLSRRVNLAIARWGAQRAAAVIVKAEWMREALGPSREDACKVHVIPNGVDLARFRPPADEGERRAIRSGLGLPVHAHIVVFGADPARPRKRFPLAQGAVAEAERRLASTAAGAAGAAPLRLLAVHDRPHDEVARVLRAADLLLFTSDVEGSPNIVKEAMASGLAIVSTDVGDTRERLQGVPGCRVVRDTPEALGAAAAELLAGDEPRGGREAVAELALERVAERVAAVYRAAAFGGAPASRPG